MTRGYRRMRSSWEQQQQAVKAARLSKRRQQHMPDLIHERSTQLPIDAAPPRAASPSQMNALRMNTSVRINRIVREHSREAQLVLLNCPGVPDDATDGHDYMSFLEVLACPRIVMYCLTCTRHRR